MQALHKIAQEEGYLNWGRLLEEYKKEAAK